MLTREEQSILHHCYFAPKKKRDECYPSFRSCEKPENFKECIRQHSFFFKDYFFLFRQMIKVKKQLKMGKWDFNRMYAFLLLHNYGKWGNECGFESGTSFINPCFSLTGGSNKTIFMNGLFVAINFFLELFYIAKVKSIFFRKLGFVGRFEGGNGRT